MRDQSPAPAHKIPAAGPRSTSSPSSPSTAKTDLHMPETYLDPQGTQAMKTDFQFNDLQGSISLQAASGIHASSEIAKDPNVHDPPHGEDYEEGASRPWTETTQSPFPELGRSQNQFCPIQTRHPVTLAYRRRANTCKVK